MRIEHDGSATPYLVTAVGLSAASLLWAATLPAAGRPPLGAVVTALVLAGACWATFRAVRATNRGRPRPDVAARHCWVAASVVFGYAVLCLLLVTDPRQAPYIPTTFMLAMTAVLTARRAERAAAAAVRAE